MSRAIILLLDSFGIGHAADAERFGDKGADTLGHICSWMAENRKNEDGSPKFYICPIWQSLGLKKLPNLAEGSALPILLPVKARKLLAHILTRRK